MEEKTIGISTLGGDTNLGNRLQNYALQKTILDNFPNFKVLTIRNNPFNYKRHEIIRSVKKHIRRFVKKFFIKKNTRVKNFKKFNKNIVFDETKYFLDDTSALNKKYSFVVAGSDQVWNEQMSDNMSTYLLNFVDSNKRISYAASLGKTELSNYEKGAFRKYLNEFKAISVREKVSCEILKEFTNKKITAVADPTLLISPQDWQKVEIKPRKTPKGKFALFCFLGNRDEKCLKFIEQTKKSNIEIVDIVNPKSKYYCSGPGEFLYFVRNASFVATDSFHCIVFSILNSTPFVHIERNDNVLKDMSSRVKNLEEMFNCKFPTLETHSFEQILNFKIENKEKILKEQKEIAIEFLKDAFKSNEDKSNNLNDVKFNCSGCGLCKNICPVGAISYKENEKGFLTPVIDSEKCIKCGKCLKSCSQLKELQNLDFESGIFAVKRKEDFEANYSSTGIVGCLIEKVLAKGGVSFAVKYDKEKSGYIKVNSVEDLRRTEGSKYFQVNASKIYPEVEKELNKNKPVLVVGTPCQITGFRNKFKNNNNLILIQIVCHGVPSQKVFKQNAIELFGKVPDEMNFRFRKEGWSNFYQKYEFENDSSKVIFMNDDVFMRAFLGNFSLNDCCYNCNYAGKQTGADVIVGDCWGIKEIKKSFYTEKGVSILHCPTECGQKLFSEVQNDFETYKIPKRKYYYCNINLFKPFKLKKDYNKQLAFYEQIRKSSVEKATNELSKSSYQANSFKIKIKRIIKKILKI